MKNFIKNLFTLIAVIAISGFVYSSSGANNETLLTKELSDTVECRYDQCHATAKSTGKRCKHCVSNEGDVFCWQHKPKK